MKNLPTPSKRKSVKSIGWAVVWPGAEKFVTPAHHWTEAAAIFSTYKRARRFADSYTAQSIMRIVKCTILYSLPNAPRKTIKRKRRST